MAVVMSGIGRSLQRTVFLRPICLLVRRVALKDCEGVNLTCVNQFKVVGDMLVNYPSSDGECSSRTNSPSASRIPESPLNNVEEGMDLLARSPGKGALVYSQRKKLEKAKFDVAVGSELALLQD